MLDKWFRVMATMWQNSHLLVAGKSVHNQNPISKLILEFVNLPPTPSKDTYDLRLERQQYPLSI